MLKALLLLAVCQAPVEKPIPPKLSVTIPEVVKPGKIINIVVDPVSGKVDGLHGVSYTYHVYPAVDDLGIDRLDGTMAWFGSGDVVDMVYTIDVSATYNYIDFEKKTAFNIPVTVRKTVTVTKGTTPAPIDPKPTDPVVPKPNVKPAGRWNISQFTADTFATTPQSIRNEIALNFRNVAGSIDSKVKAGGTMTATEITNLISASNHTTFDPRPADAAKYGPLLVKVADKMNLQKANLKTTADWTSMLTEVAIGLE